jgi:hypothetical protein
MEWNQGKVYRSTIVEQDLRNKVKLSALACRLLQFNRTNDS